MEALDETIEDHSVQLSGLIQITMPELICPLTNAGQEAEGVAARRLSNDPCLEPFVN